MVVESASKYRIAAGKYYRPYDWPEPYVQKSPIKSIEKAKKYIGIHGNYGADIALIRLEIQLNITELVKPVCIDWDNKYESEQLQSGQLGKVGTYSTISLHPIHRWFVNRSWDGV